MRDTNQVTIVGRLAKGITLTTNNNGTSIGRFPLATTTSRKTANGWEDVSNFFDVTVFGSTAKNLADYLLQGKQVCVTGELHQDRWQDKSGNKYYGVYIVATNVQLLGGNRNNQQSNTQQQSAPSQPLPQNHAYIENPPMTQADYDAQQNEREVASYMQRASQMENNQNELLDENGNEIIY